MIALPRPMKSALLASTAIVFISTPALAQSADNPADIVVTARRVEERLQDVPIAITVLNQQTLTNNNVSSMKDLATTTPGLQVNSRYGADSTNFSIRGFTQEQRTYATVGTYFGDVVAPRGSGGTFGGDGAGPGSLFDLQNVQVLKGPQGTLQGRNSTGGAVLLVPRKPTGRLEGYVEGSIGDYAMRRVQAVLNLPLADTFRVRLGIDHMKRDGYLRNIGTLGDGAYGNHGMGDVDYWAGRLSIVGDLTPNLENYTIASFSRSQSNGTIPHTTQCFGGVLATSAAGGLPFGDGCAAQMAREAPYGPWTVENRLPNSESSIRQWQIINTTTWLASDTLTIKNIASYGEFKGTTNLDLFGNYFPIAYNPAGNPRVTLAPASSVTSGNQVTGFAFTSANPFNHHTNAESSFVEELQFQGRPEGGKFFWQGGLYAEINNPLGASGVQTSTLAACADIGSLNCAFGSPNFQMSSSKFRDYAVYGQASYSITDKLKFTAGARYTWDSQDAVIQIATLNIAAGTVICNNISYFGSAAAGRTFAIADRYSSCKQPISTKTSAPTWLIDLDYKPIDDVLLYAKWSRGYRQGGISLFSPDTTQKFDKEKVDTYEVGAKTSWHGSLPGSFNVAAFYNNFRNQQLLLGVTSSAGLAAPSASIVNAGKSYMEGIEADLNLRPFQGFNLSVGYAYLKTKLQAFVTPSFAPGSLYDTATPPVVGGAVPNSIPHRFNVTGNYTLPLPASIGRISIGGTWVYTSKYTSVADACPGLGTVASPATPGCYGANFPGYPPVVINAAGATAPGISNPGGGNVPGTHVVNLNVNWENVAQLPVDASFFVTNLTNEVVYLNVNENTSRGFRSSLLGEPRMYGFRLKYHF
jgi:iron complex outermembrane receptor protein